LISDAHLAHRQPDRRRKLEQARRKFVARADEQRLPLRTARFGGHPSAELCDPLLL
jgi:hypothetical protein